MLKFVVPLNVVAVWAGGMSWLILEELPDVAGAVLVAGVVFKTAPALLTVIVLPSE